MIKQEIIEKISKYFKLTQFEAEKIYDDIFSGIIQGVKEDNIADITNLGEFIIKYNNADNKNKKTVEFLPTLSLEEEINQRSFEEKRQFEPAKFENPIDSAVKKENIASPVTEQIPNENKDLSKTTENVTDYKVLNSGTGDEISDEEKHNVEDEIKRKREEILSKITKPQTESIKKPEITKTEIEQPEITSPVIPVPVIPVTEEKNIDIVNREIIQNEVLSAEKTDDISREIQNYNSEKNLKTEKQENIQEININNEEKSSNMKDNTPEKSNEVNSDSKDKPEEITEKSFSDYFTEISKEEQNISAGVNKLNMPPAPPVIESNPVPPVDTVIPPDAVELHNQITGDQNKTNEYQTTLNPSPYAGSNGNGNANGNDFEHRLQDNSYYIWYKDSEPNSSDTQTMSYEYELLYQATKEAEYKSKLRIYVTTFIMFFSIVLILLIFSPVIYKYFFTPKEDQNTEEVQDETSFNDNQQNQNNPEQNNNSQNNNSQNNSSQNNVNPNNQAQVNTLDNQPPVENKTQEPPAQEQPKQERPKQEAPKQEAPKQEAPKQETPKQETPKQETSQSIAGVTKTSMGWIDDNNKVIYIQLENGKFTIQESAWDTDAKANKRISVVGGLFPGLKGSIVKVDLGSKGTWYRARFGEFSTIDEAKQKAEQLRNKEKNKLQALLLTFLLYT